MRAIKLFTTLAMCLIVMPALATKTLTCVSENKGFVRCDLSNADQRDIRIKSVKSGSCDIDNAWGVDSSAIWVDKGCSAVFEYTEPASAQNSSGDSVYIAPDYNGPIYGPGFYYGAGFYEYNNWNNNDYCNGHNCNHNQEHNNYQNNYYGNEHGTTSHQEEEFERESGAMMRGGGGGGFHGGGGRR